MVAALAISAFGLRAPFVFDAGTFVVGAAVVAPLQLGPITRPQATSSPLRELRTGLQLAQAIPEVRRTLALAAAVVCSWGSFFVLEPLYVRDVLHRAPALLGLFQTAFGVGLVGATLVLPHVGDRVASVRALAVSVAVSGFAAALYVGTHVVAVAFCAVFVWGVDVAFFLAPMQTLLQRATPVEAHGRVLSLAATLEGLGGVVAIPLTGLAVAALGVAATGAAVGMVAIIAGGLGVAVVPRVAPEGPSAPPAGSAVEAVGAAAPSERPGG
jgi:predicted MFS family arabinose efflux permease